MASFTADIHGIRLWGHQRQAVKSVLDYLNAREDASSIRDQGMGSALAHMPTGSGKTGVIATLCRCVPRVKSCVVLAPRRALRDQLAVEIRGRFFEKLGCESRIRSAQIMVLDERVSLRKSSPSFKNKIVISTIHKLDAFRREDFKRFQSTIKDVDLVVFDEGHYEPSLSWSRTVRTFQCGRLIVTATPFRDDLKLFDINYAYASTYSFSTAVKERFIRDVQICDIGHPKSPEQFVWAVQKAYKAAFGQNIGKKGPRLIIRCSTAAEIRNVAIAVRAAGISYVAIHDAFSDRGENDEYKSVPTPDATEACVWIHQNKLLEGLDDSRFQAVALYRPLRTIRQLVQQIGRVVRNPTRASGAIGHVFATSDSEIADHWRDYLAYGRLIDQGGMRELDYGSKIVQAVTDACPSIIYLDGRFRSSMALKDLDVYEDLQLPLRVNVYDREKDLDLKDLARELVKRFRKDDRIVEAPIAYGEDGFALFSIRMRNSSLLRRKAFVEVKLAVTIIHCAGDYVCYFDSGLSRPRGLVGIGLPIRPELLQRLFPESRLSRLRGVGLVNSSTAGHAVRSRVVTAHSMAKTVPQLDDHSFVCRHAEGYVLTDDVGGGSEVRTYVSFASGRIAQASSTARKPFREYIEWLESVAKNLRSDGEVSAQVLGRYASTTMPPPETDARSIHIDTGTLEEVYLTNSGIEGVAANEPLRLDSDVIALADGAGVLRANGRDVRLTVEFDGPRNRYMVRSPALDEQYFSTNRDFRGLCDSINREQGFQVIPETKGVIYAFGQFFDPRLQLGPKNTEQQNAILSALTAVPEFDRITSEKGTKSEPPKGNSWALNSLFRMIDRLGGTELRVGMSGKPHSLAGRFEGSELLVCDDLLDEIADFIMCKTTAIDDRQIVFIHCKARKPGKRDVYSATSLSDVCVQAVKNAHEYMLFDDSSVDRAQRWGKAWNGPYDHVVKRRIRRGPRQGARAWKKFREYAEGLFVKREVWVFAANIYSRSKLQKDMRAKEPSHATYQAVYTIAATMNAISAASTQLRIFCNP